MSKKICLLVGSLSSGGAEKVAANMSKSFTKKGYDIYIVSMRNEIDYEFAGELFNFGLVKANYNKFEAFLKFKQYFENNKFDYIIDHRTRDKFLKEWLFSKFVFKNYNIIYCIHNYRLAYYFSFLKIPWLSRLPHVKKRVFVSVSNEIQKHLKQQLNVESKTIYNFLNTSDLSFPYEDDAIQEDDYIIAVGRLTTIKQFDKLIISYHLSELPKKGIKLLILGDGIEKSNLKSLITLLKLENHAKLLPFRKNPFGLIKNAKALVLTSKVEGFPMVLLEALSLNTPVIAFDCKSGPSEIIQHKYNGLLVENQNSEALTQALNKLIEEAFYKNLKDNTKKGLEQFSEEYIVQEWMKVFENQM